MTVCGRVMADLREREREGMRRYGAVLDPNDGRDMLWEAYMESLDMAIYLRAEIDRRAQS